jgi:hypothetical protein
MTKAIQVKLLLAILAVLVVIAGLLIRGGRPAIVLTQKDVELQKKLAQKVQPSDRRYLVP